MAKMSGRNRRARTWRYVQKNIIYRESFFTLFLKGYEDGQHGHKPQSNQPPYYPGWHQGYQQFLRIHGPKRSAIAQAVQSLIP